jgi:hypothetical protein
MRGAEETVDASEPAAVLDTTMASTTDASVLLVGVGDCCRCCCSAFCAVWSGAEASLSTAENSASGMASRAAVAAAEVAAASDE